MVTALVFSLSGKRFSSDSGDCQVTGSFDRSKFLRLRSTESTYSSQALLPHIQPVCAFIGFSWESERVKRISG